jgi:tetratricopeptide (TPR) repeat protein
MADREPEVEEFLGYHLERAYAYRAELGVVDAAGRKLADRARRRLGSAGLRAFRRGDTRAAINLLERASALPATDERAGLELAPDLGFALFQAGELERAETVLRGAIESASAIGDDDVQLRATLVQGQLRVFTSWEEVDIAATTREVEASIAALQHSGDELALARAYLFLWFLHQFQGAPAPRREYAERAFEHARRAGSRLDESWALCAIGYSLLDGPTAVAQCVEIGSAMLRRLDRDPLGQATVNAFVAPLLAMQGRFEEAQALAVQSRAVIYERTTGTRRAIVDLWIARTALLAGDLDEAERAARIALTLAVDIADSWFVVLSSIDLARVLCGRGDAAQALQLLEESEHHPSPPDWEILCRRPAVRALALARLDRLAEAEAFAQQAVRQVQDTECLGFHADALRALAEVLQRSDRVVEAAAALADAMQLLERKGNIVGAAETRAALLQLA